MSVEVRPIGDKCNIKCVYCYQEGIRAAGNVRDSYAISEIIDRLEQQGEAFSLFGGEIMLLPRRDLEELLAYGYERHGGCTVQTNGTLVSTAHLDLFERYSVRLGISIDGPGPLNDARWAGSLIATRRSTARTEGLIAVLTERGTPPNLIVTLHRGNASKERLSILCDWLRFLDRSGVTTARVHLLEVDDLDVGATLKLGAEEGLAVMRRLRALQSDLTSMRFDVFDEVEAMLLADDAKASCTFHVCDPYATRAVTGVEGDGRLTNCGRTNKDGKVYMKAGSEVYHRQVALYNTPFEDGGCQGCRFFLMCKGNCPGMAEGGDWRKRTSDCALWFGLFSDAERDLTKRGKQPISTAPERLAMEETAIQAWSAGLSPSLNALREIATATDAEPEV